MNTDLWDSVMQKAEGQRAKGLAKYGKPVTADDTIDWLEHAIEEQLDSAVYLEAAKSVIDSLRQQVVDKESEVALLTEKNKALLTECGEWEKLVSSTEREQRSVQTEQENEIKELKAVLAESTYERMAQAEQIEERDNKIERLETYLKRANANTAEAIAACKRLESSKERAEKDAASLLKRLKDYHQSEGTLALAVAGACMCIGLAVGYWLACL